MARLPEESRVPAAFALLVVGTLIFAAAHGSFWQRKHDMAPVAAAVILVLLGLLLQRRRFAWWVFVAFSGIGLVSWVVNLSSQQITGAWIVGGLLGLLELGAARRAADASVRPTPRATSPASGLEAARLVQRRRYITWRPTRPSRGWLN